jgi:hypothetical protein
MSTRAIVMLTLVSFLALGSAFVAEASAVPELPEGWSIYHDARFDFSTVVPPGWAIEPRNDDPGVYSVLTFRSQPLKDGSTHVLHIGYHRTEIDSDEPILTWSEGISSRSRKQLNVVITKAEDVLHNGADATLLAGWGDLGSFELIHIRHGRLIWFVWANFSSATSPEAHVVFERVVGSLRLSESTPTTLGMIEGPQALEARGDLGSPMAHEVANEKLSTAWVSPVYGTYSCRCDSDYHEGASEYAIDVPMIEGTSLHASNLGKVVYCGLDTSGYGNLVEIDTGAYIHFYAHMKSFASGLSVNDWVSRGQEIGKSGNTGISTGAHLHFHVQYNGAGIDLRGMDHFTATATYPEGKPCGELDR